jgi:hypothetical protein
MRNILVPLLLLSLLFGCASPARIDQMAANIPVAAVDAKLKKSIALLDVTGGRETNAMWTSQVASDDFRRALEISLERAGLLSKISSEGRFQLIADLSNLQQPIAGIDMTVTASVQYSLIERKSKKEVYRKVIQQPYTAKFSDAFLGTERLRLANEGAINANISAFIRDIFSLELSDDKHTN